MKIRIIGVPPGEAPEQVRKAWVGLVLPLAPKESGPRKVFSYGVVTGPRRLFGVLWHFLTGRLKWSRQYVVPVDSAIDILEKTSPEAAKWWRENTPHLFGGYFLFDPIVCTETAEE